MLRWDKGIWIILLKVVIQGNLIALTSNSCCDDPRPDCTRLEVVVDIPLLVNLEFGTNSQTQKAIASFLGADIKIGIVATVALQHRAWNG